MDLILGITFNPPTGVKTSGVNYLCLIDAQGGVQAEIAREWDFWTTDADIEMRRRHVFLPRIQLQS